jgi:hypothetical protein
MGQRLELQAILVDILGSNHVYFQPPPSVLMVYPCIVYNRDDENTDFAGNLPYKKVRRYQVISIDRNPDSDIPAKIADLPLCVYDRFYAADDLNHDVYKLFF